MTSVVVVSVPRLDVEIGGGRRAAAIAWLRGRVFNASLTPLASLAGVAGVVGIVGVVDVAGIAGVGKSRTGGTPFGNGNTIPNVPK